MIIRTEFEVRVLERPILAGSEDSQTLGNWTDMSDSEAKVRYQTTHDYWS